MGTGDEDVYRNAHNYQLFKSSLPFSFVSEVASSLLCDDSTPSHSLQDSVPSCTLSSEFLKFSLLGPFSYLENILRDLILSQPLSAFSLLSVLATELKVLLQWALWAELCSPKIGMLKC